MKYKISLVSSIEELYIVAPGEFHMGSRRLQGINSLLLQLSPGSILASWSSVESFFRAGNVMAALTYGTRLVGIAHLVFDHAINRVTCRIEDVVIDKKHRGMGLSPRLMKPLIDTAKKRNARHIDLTSKPERIAANRLYVKLGFTKRTTNVYRLSL